MRILEMAGQLLDMIGDAMKPDPRGGDIPMSAREVLGGAAWIAAMWALAWVFAAVV